MNFSEFKDKRVLITGCSSGIGYAQTKAFVDAKAIVYGIDINDFESEKSANFVFYRQDLKNANAVNKILSEIGTIDILINTAGILDAYAPILETTLDDFQNVMSTNLTSMFVTCKSVLPQMIAQKSGVIINMCSIAGMVAGGGGIAYTTSKHAVSGFTKQLALDYAKYNIKVNAIAPGAIQTPMNAADFEGDGEMAKWVANETPDKRWGTAEEVASLTLFLASTTSNYIQGAVIPIDGGWVIK